jgi:hypothetical protein
MRSAAAILSWVVLVSGMALAQDAVPQNPAAPANTSANPPAASGAQEPTLADVMGEISDLRAEVLRIQQTLDTYMNGVLANLQVENERLRREVRQLSTEKGRTLPHVPMPDKELLEGLYEKKDDQTASPDQAAGPGPVETPEKKTVSQDTGGAFHYEVVAEWGRTPAEAAQMEPKAASLKGMIGVVPAGSSEPDLMALGQSLRAQFGEYDNVNIEVFDDRETARAYKEKSVAAPEHRVLSISKHRASGRDVILLIKGDQVSEVPVTASPEKAPSP